MTLRTHKPERSTAVAHAFHVYLSGFNVIVKVGLRFWRGTLGMLQGIILAPELSVGFYGMSSSEERL